MDFDNSILWNFQTENNCDSTEFCPVSKSLMHSEKRFFVCGNYELIETKKFGKLYLFELKKSQANYEIKQHQKLDRSAILDLKWSSKLFLDEKILLGGALENGKLEIWNLEDRELKSLKNIEIDSSVCLSLNWNNSIYSFHNPKIIVSLSNGKIAICQLNDSSVEIVNLWKGHEYETWIANFDSFHPDLVFSGADDCFFKGWDMRKPLNQSIFQINYDAGVTSIQPNPYTENQIAVGSYDDTLSIWDLRTMKIPISKLGLGGGVWRIKWHPTLQNLLLLACMRTGFKIVKWKEASKEFEIIDEIQKQCEALAYGTDWCYYQEEDWPNLIVTGTFYNKTCSIWKPKL